MSQAIDDFKAFVKVHPGLKKLVYDEHKSWQSIFEEWSLLGPEHETWLRYVDEDVQIEAHKESVSKPKVEASKEVMQLGDMIKTCVNYVKKIDPDSVTKTVNNIQKLMSLVAGIGAANTINAKNKMTGDPLFDKRFDEWY